MDAIFDLRWWEHSFQCSKHPKNERTVSNVLGLSWDRVADVLFINLYDNLSKDAFTKVTKKVLLSAAHRIFDPLGLACPVTLCPKLLLQLT